MRRPIRVLVVDDSAFMRAALARILAAEEDIDIAGTAGDGVEAVEKVAALRPDVVTMDIEMPRMDGLAALRRIMATHPRPVIMVSSLTQEGATATLDALEAGAVDFIPKASSADIRQALVEKVRAVAGRRTPWVHRPGKSVAPGGSAVSMADARMLLIGTSTGGPSALQHVIPLLPRDFPFPVAVVQHMPPRFTRSLAERLDSQSALEVKEAENGDAVVPGRVLIAPGGRHLMFEHRKDGAVAITPDRPETDHRPSVDIMFESAGHLFNGRVAAVVMTGMGRDGREGSRMIRAAGGTVIAQDEASCVVFGMPRAVIEAGLASAVVPLADLAATCIAGLRTPALPHR